MCIEGESLFTSFTCIILKRALYEMAPTPARRHNHGVYGPEWGHHIMPETSGWRQTASLCKEKQAVRRKYGKGTPRQKMNNLDGERQGTRQNKTGLKSEVRAPSHPISWKEKNCPKLATVWITPCCLLILLLREGINFLLNEVVMMKIVIPQILTWSGRSWKWLDSPQLALHSSCMGILRSHPPVQHTSSSEEEHAPLGLHRVACGVVQSHKRRWPNPPRCRAVQRRSQELWPGLPESTGPSVGRGVPRALGSCGLKPAQYGACRQPPF